MNMNMNIRALLYPYSYSHNFMNLLEYEYIHDRSGFPLRRGSKLILYQLNKTKYLCYYLINNISEFVKVRNIFLPILEHLENVV